MASRARLKARAIYNETIQLTQRGYSRTEIQREVDRDDFLANNKCAGVRKAHQTWASYQALFDEWREQADSVGEEPTPPSTEKSCCFPLVMAYREGYNLSADEETGRVQFRISPKPYKRVKGHLRSDPAAMADLKQAVSSDEMTVGQAELLYRDGVYYLHVTVTREFDIPDPDTATTLVGVDFNEANVALTALDRATMETRGTLVVEYTRLKAERQRYHTITKRCQAHGNASIHRKLGDKEERFTDWVLHRLSRVVVAFAEQFSNPVIVFEDLAGIRDGIQYGAYMNRRLHKLPFHKFEEFVSYKATWREIPTDSVDAYHNSQTCSCCGERGNRRGRRFTCTNDECAVIQDHADRNASVNVAWREKAKLDATPTDYRTHKTQPQVRLVRLSGPGRISRPAASRSLAEQGVLTACGN